MSVKKYKKLLIQIQSAIDNWNFSVEKNEKILNKIMRIYKLSRQKKHKEVKKIINEMFSKEINSDDFIKTNDRDWEFPNYEDEIEAYNSIEILSGIFLQNLKDEIWKK